MSRVCSLSLIVTEETLLSSNWASATEVGTCLKPPLPRKNEENTTARTTTRPTQNHTERKIFLRSIHRCRAPGRPGQPVDPPDRPVTPPATRAGTPALGGASSPRRYTGAAVGSVDENRKPSDIPRAGHHSPERPTCPGQWMLSPRRGP